MTRPRKQISRDLILRALDGGSRNVELAALLVSEWIGEDVSSRTLRRRMAEYGIKRATRYELGEAA